jgi:hypothetical protein
MTKKTGKEIEIKRIDHQVYTGLLTGVSDLLEQARYAAARSVNAVITATYWEIGHRIVEYEQGGDIRAEYKTGLLGRLSKDLTSRFGRGFSVDNLETMRLFYKAYPTERISETLSRKFNLSDLSGAFHKEGEGAMSKSFPMVHISKVAYSVERLGVPLPGTVYRQVGVHLWGEGG